MKNLKFLRVLLVSALGFGAGVGAGVGALAQEGPITVEIRGGPGNFTLYRGGEPYHIRGAGAETLADLESLAGNGANSVRTWRPGDGSVLDIAQELGLTVALCIEITRERHGFDYDDAEAVARQFEQARDIVLRYRDHPALLFWIIGNEMNLEAENPRVYDAVNEISRMIHELDPHHPTTTTTAGISPDLARIIQQRAPDLDFLSVQVYGDVFNLPQRFADLDPELPLMVTEWGTIGHWEVPVTEWGAPIELHSSAKAAVYRRGFEEILAPMQDRLVGNYAFLWGQKQERTPTWYGVFTADGRATEAVDELHRIWSGQWPDNRAPRIGSMRLDGRGADQSVRLTAGEEFSASVEAEDPDGDTLIFDWRVMEESTATEVGGDREEIPPVLDGLIADPARSAIALRAPERPGAYRLFVYVGDGRGRVAHANIPFFVDASP